MVNGHEDKGASLNYHISINGETGWKNEIIDKFSLKEDISPIGEKAKISENKDDLVNEAKDRLENLLLEKTKLEVVSRISF